MAKKVKKQHPRVSVPLKTTPWQQNLEEIERLLRAHEERQLDDWQIAPRLRELAQSVGTRQAFEELVNRARGPKDEVRSSVVWALGLLGSAEAIPWLWDIVRMPHKSLPARTAALKIIEGLGGHVQVDELPDDLLLRMYGSLGRLGWVMGEVAEAKTARDVEMALLPLNHLPHRPAEDGRPHGRELLLSMVEVIAHHSPSQAGADFLQALADTTTDSEVRSAAERAVSQLRALGIEPASPAVLALHGQQFYKAYTGDVPDSNSQEGQVVVAWRSSGGTISALIFTIDRRLLFGGLNDVDLTEDMTEQGFRRRFVEAGWLTGKPLREVPLQEARGIIQKGVESTRRQGRPLPGAYEQFLPIIERRVLQPT